ncbi:MAG: alpha/beta hydrolase [Deltaproteobacteria bacterium]|nr:alpha/beta hydrolase [Deltaproteobacteria bacterium]
MAEIQQDVVYAKGSGRDLKLDLYRPDDAAATGTAVLLLHGGGWRFGDRGKMERFGLELARLGFVALAPEYRLLGEAPWPAQIEDVKAAIRWTRANAGRLEIHPDRIAVQGFSAGGHLALLAGGTPALAAFEGRGGNEAVSDRVAAVVAFFPAVALSVENQGPGIKPASALLGESATEAEAKQASPITYASADYPPTFLLHGTADTIIPFTTSLQMFETLQEKGVMVELHLYPGHTHEFVRLPSMLATVQSEIALFLKRTVVDPERYIQENLSLNMFAKGKR